ncbi:unnamed protein product [Dovyalis caffra]|uniref:Uncharacterized protein n=1 Tax=Dovyalis caffra TaxID=77055 RepID=A0AAV1S2M0_9ROSI|nr:unnamed protein product [Dovyalis caffra]
MLELNSRLWYSNSNKNVINAKPKRLDPLKDSGINQKRSGRCPKANPKGSVDKQIQLNIALVAPEIVQRTSDLSFPLGKRGALATGPEME